MQNESERTTGRRERKNINILLFIHRQFPFCDQTTTIIHNNNKMFIFSGHKYNKQHFIRSNLGNTNGIVRDLRHL